MPERLHDIACGGRYGAIELYLNDRDDLTCLHCEIVTTIQPALALRDHKALILE